MFQNQRRLAVQLGVVFAIGGWSVVANAATSISACQTLSAAGNYVLTANLKASGANCLTLTHSNIAIDLAGHSITGDGTHSGIIGDNLVNIVISNGKISDLA